MATHLPHGLQKLLEVTVGMPWPEGDEEDLWDFASAWESFGGDLDTLAAALIAEANNFAHTIQGQAGDKLNTLLAVDMHTSAVQLKEQADTYAKMLRNAGADIQKTKIMIIGMLAILAATIAALLASLFGSFAVPSVIAAARVGIGALLRSLLARLMQVGLVNIARELAIKTAIGGLAGAGFMVGFDSAIQGVQIAQGHRDGFDTEALKGDAIGGAIGGALGGVAEGIGGLAAKVGRDIWRSLPRGVRGFGPLGHAVLQVPAAALSNPIINTATHSPGNTIDGIFGALGGGGRAHLRVPTVPPIEVRPLSALDLLGLTSAVTPAQDVTMVPVTGAAGGRIGAGFTTPVISGQGVERPAAATLSPPVGDSAVGQAGTLNLVTADVPGGRTEQGAGDRNTERIPAEGASRRVRVSAKDGPVGRGTGGNSTISADRTVERSGDHGKDEQGTADRPAENSAVPSRQSRGDSVFGSGRAVDAGSGVRDTLVSVGAEGAGEPRPAVVGWNLAEPSVAAGADARNAGGPRMVADDSRGVASPLPANGSTNVESLTADARRGHEGHELELAAPAHDGGVAGGVGDRNAGVSPVPATAGHGAAEPGSRSAADPRVSGDRVAEPAGAVRRGGGAPVSPEAERGAGGRAVDGSWRVSAEIGRGGEHPVAVGRLGEVRMPLVFEGGRGVTDDTVGRGGDLAAAWEQGVLGSVEAAGPSGTAGNRPSVELDPASGARAADAENPASLSTTVVQTTVSAGEEHHKPQKEGEQFALAERSITTTAVPGPLDGGQGRDNGILVRTPAAGEPDGHTVAGEPLSPSSWVERARVERPKVAGEIDGAAVREAVQGLLGLTDSRSDQVLRAMVEQQFSDANLTEGFPRAVDGGVVVDLGPRSHSAPQIRLEVIGLGTPSDIGRGVADFAAAHSREPSTSSLANARAAVLTEVRAYRIPTPLVTFGLKIAGLVNARGSDLTSISTHGRETTVVEPGVPVEKARHDVTYQVTVRTPRTWPWAEGLTCTDVVSAGVPLMWPKHEEAPAAVMPPVRLERPQDIAHAEFSELGEIYRRVEHALGKFPVSHEGARTFRDWLYALPASAPELFSGEPVRQSFNLPGTRGRVEVSVSIADTVVVRPLPSGEGTIQRTREVSGESSAGQSVLRRWGGGAVVMFGDVTGTVLGGAVGPTTLAYGSTKTETRVTEKFREQLADVYRGPIDKQRVRFSYVVSVGGEPAKVFTVDGAATVWAKPHQPVETAVPAIVDEPGSSPRPVSEPVLPQGIDPSPVLDQVAADYRLPEATLDHLIGPVLHRLSGEGIVKARHLPEIHRRFRRFLEDNARELVRGGNGVRFPLSAWHKNAPDVFVRGMPRITEARYLGVVERESRSVVVSAGHQHSVEITRGKDFDAGVAGMGYDSEATDYRQAGFSVTYKANRRDVENIAHEIRHEQSIANEGRTLHRVRYPAEFEVRVGGRWGDPAEKLYWRDDTATGAPVFRGEVEVVAPERAGLTPGPGSQATGENPPVWQDGSPPESGHRAGYLPPGFQLDALKPVPDLLGTVTRMIDAPSTSRFAGWLRAPLVGRRPAGFDEHKGLGVWGREPGRADERNAARDVLENFASLPVRAGRFERAALYQDTVRLKSHNRAGLAGSRERVAQVDLAARLANPRILGMEEAHRFTATEVVAADRSTHVTRGSGVKAKIDLFEVPIVNSIVNPAGVLGGSIMRTRQDGLSHGEGLTESVSRTRSERGYLVAFDANYEVRTSVHRDWHDAIGFRHDGRIRQDAKWVSVPDAATVWVPAGEIHRVGVLADADVTRLGSAEARRYRQEHPEETGLEPGALDTVIHEDGAPPPEAGPLLPPSDVGRGSGRVELHRLEAATELLTQIALRLGDWTAQHERAPEPNILDLTREAFGFSVPDRPNRRTVEFAPINERLVRDVLGPTLTGSQFTPALREMLTAGRSIFLEGTTPFGKVEQLVVLRATLGAGAYHRTVETVSVQDGTATVRRSGSSSARGWAGEFFAGVVAYSSVSGPGKPGGTAGGYVAGTHTFRKQTEVSQENIETVTAARTDDTAEFLHDLHVTMDVYPYAGAGHYRKLLPGARKLSEPWSTEFSLPGAVRSSVPMGDTIRAGERPAPPLAEAGGSLTAWQQSQDLPPGLGDDAVLRVRPFESRHLHRALDQLARGDGGRPALQPSALHRLLSAAGSLPLRAHLRELLSPDGYVVKVAGDRLSQVTISADVVKRELVRVLDEPLRSSTTEQQSARITEAHHGDIGPNPYVNLSATYVDDSTQRPGGALHEAYSAWQNWERSRTIDASYAKEVTKPDGTSLSDVDTRQRRYLIRLIPRWHILPSYRSAKAQAAWGKAMRTETDTPILIETDHNGLKHLGLAEPGAKVRREPLPAIEEEPPVLRERAPHPSRQSMTLGELLGLKPDGSRTRLGDILGHRADDAPVEDSPRLAPSAALTLQDFLSGQPPRAVSKHGLVVGPAGQPT